MSAYKQLIRFHCQVMCLIMLFTLEIAVAYASVDADERAFNGMTRIIGNVVATPCSIVMPNRHQTINFSPLTLTMLSTMSRRERYNQPFIIELRDCGSVYSSIDSKTWSIRFDGQKAQQIEAFVLRGPSQGLGVSVLNDQSQVLIPGQNYPLSHHVLRQNKSGQTLFLRYFLRLELTGQPIQAGNYQGLIRFFIDYQ
ncbi:fimbrial protein [Providencia vermicola]|uniref:Fimbrial protein n=1 Tax=Providencia vermicola TaxID=333965 RepID=A0AAX3RYL8_9GAMM|nr:MULTISPECIES: fimbrial protein [Providencia]USB38311.1 type 1 fimbrial protein [Providencia vermicola]WFC07247.1 fimbrial protein [Providencia vermicola]